MGRFRYPYGRGEVQPLWDRMLRGDRAALAELAALQGDNERALEDYLSRVGAGSGGRPYATVVVAAAGSVAADKANADFVCDGSDDGATINLARDAAGSGRVVLLEGYYRIDGAFPDMGNVELVGMGPGTHLETYSVVYGVKSWGLVADLQVTEITPVAGGGAGIYSFGQSARIERCITNGFNEAIGGNTDTAVVGCTANTSTLYGIRGAGRILRNKVKSGQGNGIAVTADDTLVQGNLVVECGLATNNVYAGILLEATCDRANVQGNTVRKAAAGNATKYGIEVVAGATDNYVTNNDLKNSGATASFFDAGTGTITAAGNRL